MKSQKGITMMSLILYVASFVVITAVVAAVTTFFYNNLQVLDSSVGSNSQYNKLNLYLLNECKKEGIEILAYKGAANEGSSADLSSMVKLSASQDEKKNLKRFITFKEADGTKNSFIYVKDTNTGEMDLYYNYIKLCEKVEDFDLKMDVSTGKTVLKVLINIDGTTFTTDYVVGG